MNAFAGTDIRLPKTYQQALQTYSQTRTEGSGANRVADSPFPRMVDMWFLALCVAVRENIPPKFDVTEQSYKAVEGVVFGSDPWRSNALILLAIAHTGKAEVVDEPAEMMRIANGYAVAGLPHLIGILEGRRGDTALARLSEYIEQLVMEVDE